MKEKTIILPEDLSTRRKLLEAELSAVVEAQVNEYLQRELKAEFNEAGFHEGTATIEWEFYGEYDDEGGTDYYPSGISITVNGETVYVEDVEYEKKYRYDNSSYQPDFEEEIREIICGYREDVYDQYITEVTVTLH